VKVRGEGEERRAFEFLPHFFFTRKKKLVDAPKKLRFEGKIRL
jgi:hypothetical protein